MSGTTHVIQKGRWRRDKRSTTLNSTIPPVAEESTEDATSGSLVDANETKTNKAAEFALQNIRLSNVFLTDPHALSAMQSIIQGGSVYLPSFFSSRADYYYYEELLKELITGDATNVTIDLSKKESSQLPKDPKVSEAPSKHLDAYFIKWSRHSVFENPQFLSIFNALLKRLEHYFDVEIYASRLNFYKDGSDWKPYHHDSHAYSKDHKNKEDFTMGASFGASRELVFLHESSSQQIPIPQHNGDVFAFTSEVNRKLKHGVPKLPKGQVGPRFSVIAWGRRRKLTGRNAAANELVAYCKDNK